MKKILLVTTVSGFVPQFEMNNVKILQSMGMEVHYATNYHMPVYGKDNRRLDNTGIVRHQIDFVRSPFQIIQNIKAYGQLKKLMKGEKFALVHCHTPMGGVLARLAARVTKTSPVLYTAHGFHFFRGATWKNWLFYYPVERMLAHLTDVLITINKEDYLRARNFKLRKNGRVEYISGIGIDSQEYLKLKMEKRIKRKELGIDPDAFLLTSVGELTQRKNHKVILQALGELNNKHMMYLICGTGDMEHALKIKVKEMELERQVLFLGYRDDIGEVLKAADCFVFPSLQEGLPVAVMEAMSVGLPVVCSKIRGNMDLISEGRGGYLVPPKDASAFAKAIHRIYSSEKNRTKFGAFNQKVIKSYDIKKVSLIMQEIYKNVLKPPDIVS